MSSSEFVTLVAADGSEYLLEERCAKHSGYLNDALSNEWEEASSKRVNLGEQPCVVARLAFHLADGALSGYIVEKICEYLVYRDKYINNAGGQIPDFMQQIPKEMALELLMAADYMSC